MKFSKKLNKMAAVCSLKILHSLYMPINKLILGDNLEILKTLEKKFYIKSMSNETFFENNRIYNSDCVSFMLGIEDCHIDLTITSPPYDNIRNYKGYNFNCEKIAKELFRITKDGGVVVWVVGDKIEKGNKTLTSFKQALLFQQIGFNVHDTMIYKKKNTPFMRSNAYTNCFEYMFVFSKGSPKTFNPLKEKTVRQGFEMLVFWLLYQII